MQIIKKVWQITLVLVNSILNLNNRTKVAGHLSISTLNNLVLGKAPTKVHRVIG